MVKFRRLSAEERKKQICEAAKEVFINKGFSATTMEDIVDASGMSKGGVYNYYKNTSDIMYDLMVEGSYYRFNLIKEYHDTHQDMSNDDLIVEILLDKLFDYNEFKSLYAMLILETSKNEKLMELYSQVADKIVDMTKDLCDEVDIEFNPAFISEPFISFFNSLVLGIELLHNRDVFLNNRDFFRNMFKKYLETYEQVDSSQKGICSNIFKEF